MCAFSGNNEDKKKKELALLMRVKSLYTQFPRGEIEPSEQPDFLISNETTTIGIELTERSAPRANHKPCSKHVRR